MITLFEFHPRWDLPNASPYCLKMETYLRMAGLPYTIKYTDNPRNAPKGKLPFIQDDGKAIGDSSLIIHYLKEKYGDKLDGQLTAEQQAQRIAFQRLLEEHLYWIMLYSRWVDEDFWPATKRAFFCHASAFLQLWVPNLIRKMQIKALYSQGMGRHSKIEIYAAGMEDIKAISSMLANNDFFLGPMPTSIDASIYGFMANILDVPLETPLKIYAKSLPNLVDYCQRMRQRFYRD